MSGIQIRLLIWEKRVGEQERGTQENIVGKETTELISAAPHCSDPVRAGKDRVSRKLEFNRRFASVRLTYALHSFSSLISFPFIAIIFALTIVQED